MHTASTVGSGGAQRQEQRGGSLRRDRLASVDTPADQVQRRKKKKKRMKLQRQSTLIRNEVESLPSFWPVCTILITLAQVNQYGDLIVSGKSDCTLIRCPRSFTVIMYGRFPPPPLVTVNNHNSLLAPFQSDTFT